MQRSPQPTTDTTNAHLLDDVIRQSVTIVTGVRCQPAPAPPSPALISLPGEQPAPNLKSVYPILTFDAFTHKGSNGMKGLFSFNVKRVVSRHNVRVLGSRKLYLSYRLGDGDHKG